MKWYFLPPLILQKLIWIPTRIILFWFGRIKVSGLENLRDLKTNAIFACNHSSESDVFLIPGTLPFFSRFSPMFYVSREPVFYQHLGWRKYFYGGIFFKAWGAYPAFVGLRDYEQSLKRHIKILRDGGNLILFPEGKRSRDGQIHEAKGGVAHLSYATKLPIVPVRLGGMFDFSFTRLVCGKVRFSIHFGKPVYESANAQRIPTYDIFKQYANRIMDTIRVLPTA